MAPKGAVSNSSPRSKSTGIKAHRDQSPPGPKPTGTKAHRDQSPPGSKAHRDQKPTEIKSSVENKNPPSWTATPCLMSSQCLATIACLFVQSKLTTTANETHACKTECLRVLHKQYVMLQPHD